MADAVRVDTLMDGPRNAVLHCTNVSDGTGEAAVVKVDMSALSGSPSALAIEHVRATTSGMAVDIIWDADTNGLALTVPADDSIDWSYVDVGGLQIPSGLTNTTGDIRFTTRDHTTGDAYSVTLWVRKK